MATRTATNGVTLRGMTWWIDRWRQSSAFTSLTVEEQGAYRNLLDEAWLRGGGIPNDSKLLARASGDPLRWPKLKKNVLKFFKNERGILTNKTLTYVRAQAQVRADKQKRYRDSRGKALGNGHGNAPSNDPGNDPG
jgi:uncharacterized protein YdaU (DUF1376 family)